MDTRPAPLVAVVDKQVVPGSQPNRSVFPGLVMGCSANDFLLLGFCLALWAIQYRSLNGGKWW